MAATTPRARALAAALREARQANGASLRALAKRIGISHTMISLWEHGHRVPEPEDVAIVLTGLGVGAGERARVVELSRHAKEVDWLAVGIPGVSQALAAVVAHERAATSIFEWSPLVVPGLLQTSEYAGQILDEARLTVRLARRDVITKREPVDFTAAIGEPALRQIIGGRDVMAHQLRELTSLLDNVNVLAVPVGEGWHPGLAGPFVLYDFPDSPSIVHVEHHRSSAFVFNEQDVAHYKEAAKAIREKVALNPAKSAQFIASVIKQMERTK